MGVTRVQARRDRRRASNWSRVALSTKLTLTLSRSACSRIQPHTGDGSSPGTRSGSAHDRIGSPRHRRVLVVWVAAICIVVGIVIVFIRDVRHVTPIAMQLLFFPTPMTYPASLIPERWRWLTTGNPIPVVVEAMRAALLRHQWPEWHLLLAHAPGGIALLALAFSDTRSVDPRLTDIM